MEGNGNLNNSYREKKGEELQSLLKQKIDILPSSPGIYFFKDPQGNVIYVGKARNLRKRVSQYFSKKSSDSRFFIHYLKRNVADIEIVSTCSEAEALILENNFIKEYKPKFNIRLKDDKDYLCIRIDTKTDYPRFELVRRPAADGARYFGPYSSGTNAKELFKFINRNFKLRTCSNFVFKSRKRPCLQYQMGRCRGPCSNPVSKKDYMEAVEKAIWLLEGRVDDLKEKLKNEMLEKSKAMEYEMAATIRDLIRAVETLDGGQRVVDADRANTDVIGFARKLERMVITIMFVRGGKVIGIRNEKFQKIGSNDEDSIESFLIQYYGDEGYIPEKVLVSKKLQHRNLIEDFVYSSRGLHIKFHFPAKGKDKQLVRMADENASVALEEWEKLENACYSRLEYLASKLHLPVIPERIECVDISHTGGKEIVGSIVSMVSGQFYKPGYRRFNVKIASPCDDYMAMEEVLSRRFERALRSEGEEKWKLPDLLVIDGGKGHLMMALALKEKYSLDRLSIVAIAKDRDVQEKKLARLKVKERLLEEEGNTEALKKVMEKTEKAKREKGVDVIYVEGVKDPIPASPTTPLGLLVKLRNEAHRFAITFHRKKRAKGSFMSQLMQVKGIGKKRVRLLHEKFAGIEELASATPEVISQKTGFPMELCAKIAEHIQALKKQPKD